MCFSEQSYAVRLFVEETSYVDLGLHQKGFRGEKKSEHGDMDLFIIVVREGFNKGV